MLSTLQTTHRTPVAVAPVAQQTRRDLDVVAIIAVSLVVIGHFWLGRVTGGIDVLLVPAK
jgi:hypothetical protein